MGWLLLGPASVPALTESCTVNLWTTHVLKIESADISHVQDVLQKFWDLETLGITDTETSVHDKFSNEKRFIGERYQLKRLFKDNHPMLSDNYTDASRRLAAVIKKLKTQPEILKQYDQVIKEQLESGVVKEVQQECVQEEDESFSKSVFKQDTEKEQQVLEMLWNPNQDELIYDLIKVLEGVDVQQATRRLILSTATRFFDPLGLISPVILPFKIMFQNLCKAQRDWDELVDTELN